MAYDLTIHDKTIRREGLRQLDFYNHPELINPVKVQRLIEKAEKVSESGFHNLKLAQTTLKGKKTYKIISLEHEIVLRILSKNIRQLTRVRQTNRLSIVRSLQKLLEEGVDYQIYKFDIKSFYETINVSDLLEQLDKDVGFSRSALKLLKSFFSQLEQQAITGLPRGLAISATLAEYVMRVFDRSIQKRPSVFFYSRFVDDIIIITAIEEKPKSLIKDIRSILPSGLNLNPTKTKVVSLSEPHLKQAEPEKIIQKLDFLGYRFNICNRKRTEDSIIRVIQSDISPSKTDKIKTKIIRCFLQYDKDQNFDDLLDRLKLLSGNYSIYDHGRGIKRKAGIYFNYSAIEGTKSKELKELDSFLKGIILSGQGKLCSSLQTKMSSEERRLLLKISFYKGFNQKVFYNYSGSRLVELMKCWKYV